MDDVLNHLGTAVYFVAVFVISLLALYTVVRVLSAAFFRSWHEFNRRGNDVEEDK